MRIGNIFSHICLSVLELGMLFSLQVQISSQLLKTSLSTKVIGQTNTKYHIVHIFFPFGCISLKLALKGQVHGQG